MNQMTAMKAQKVYRVAGVAGNVIVALLAGTGALLSILGVFGVFENVEPASVRVLNSYEINADEKIINVHLRNTGEEGTRVGPLTSVRLERSASSLRAEATPILAETHDMEVLVYENPDGDTFEAALALAIPGRITEILEVQCLGVCSGTYSFVILLANEQRILVEGAFSR